MPGDPLRCYADRVTEAMSPENEELGEARLLAVAMEHLGRSAAGVIEAVRDAVEDHTHGAPQYDDLTLLALDPR